MLAPACSWQGRGVRVGGWTWRVEKEERVSSIGEGGRGGREPARGHWGRVIRALSAPFGHKVQLRASLLYTWARSWVVQEVMGL